jgi:hypothetical protein
MASQSTLLGAAGEYFVMSALLRHGFIAALAPQGVPTADIVVTDLQGARLCSIQVKTRRDVGSDRGWHMKAKHEEIRGDRFFYCFLDFGKTHDTQPTVFILPSAVVADTLKCSHKKWLATPGKRGQQRKDTEMRRLLPDYTRVWTSENPYPAGWLEKYRDAWSLLGLDADEVNRNHGTGKRDE